MTDFDTLLKASFAEADMPADDGFSARVSHGVERRERVAQLRNVAYSVGMAAGGAAVAYGLFGIASAYGPQMMASFGLEVARAHGALASAPTPGAAAQGLMQAVGAGLSQILLTIGVLAGGAVAYRATQQN